LGRRARSWDPRRRRRLLLLLLLLSRARPRGPPRLRGRGGVLRARGRRELEEERRHERERPELLRDRLSHWLIHRVFERHGLAATDDRETDFVGTSEGRERVERGVGVVAERGDIEAVDRADHVAVLHAEAPEERRAADAVELCAHDLAVLLVGA